MIKRSAFVIAGLVAAASLARAQEPPPAPEAPTETPQTGERPSEEELFGPSQSAQPPPEQGESKGRQAPEAPATTRGGTRPAGAPAGEAAPPTATTGAERALREEPLAIGGILYLRSFVAGRRGDSPSDWQLSLPALVDGYLDARPNDRVRGLVLARLLFDASGSTAPVSTVGAGTGTTNTGESGATGTAGGPFTSTPPANPRVLLDQLWVRFDVSRTVFVTAGKQHVKWGTAHFWTPEDFLHRVPRDPLAVFDERTGVTMLKLDVPWEAMGMNFYGVGVFDLAEPASTIGRVGGAARAELVLGTAELGADILAQRGYKPRIGVDASAGVGPFDVYVESTLTTEERTRWRLGGTGACPYGLAAACERVADPWLAPSVSAGVSWSAKYSDEDSLTLGAELFYNDTGYDDPAIYPIALSAGELIPFYAGRRYAGVYFLLPKPGSWNDTTVILSTLANLTDRSFVSRLDWQVLVLTYLQVQAFGSVHYGREGGELRFALDLPRVDLGNGVTTSINVPPPVFEAGIALQIAL